MENEGHVIKFYLGEETKPVVEGVERYEHSIFRYQIQQALRAVVARIGGNTLHPVDSSDESHNNIVAFVGERGAGKTSCMYSVIRILEDINRKEIRWERKEPLLSRDEDRILQATHFSFIHTIDPSFFDIKHNILELIIGKMYAHIQGLATNQNKDWLDSYSLQALLKAFQETKTFLRYISSETKFEDDTMEELVYLASGVDLKESIKKLICAYLKYVQKDMLVISLDDIDLNTSQAFTMVEQIRKYLILPNVVIFLAIKLNQLSEVIQLELSKQFQPMLSSKQMSFTEVVEMAERYLLKLIPLQSRVYLPIPETFFNRTLEIYQEGNLQPDKYDSIKRAVPELIFKKCRYLFYNTRGTTSLIVPRNLRELRLLISMLYRMPDYQKNTNKTEGNKQLFKRYFFGSWLDTLEKKSRDVAYTILAENEPTLFNKTVIRQLVKLYFEKKEADIPEKYKDIVDMQNLAFNVSLGDCFYFMEYISNINLDTETKKLIFFIKSVYSIRLYEYYDELTDGLRNSIASESSINESINKEEQPYRAEILEDISSYEKLVGGSFYFLEGDNLIGPQRIYGGFLDREVRLINGEKFFELIKEVKENRNKLNNPEIAEEERNAYISKLRLAEFFMLTISRYVWTTNVSLTELGIHKYRLNAPAYYDRRITRQTKNLSFDVLAPFFTLLNMRHAYERFDEEIYDIAVGCEESLVKKLYGKKSLTQDRFLSMVGLRNAEIIEDIFNSLKLDRRKLKIRTTARNIDILMDFYKLLSFYQIASYDYENEGGNEMNEKKISLYHIKLDYFTHFGDLLREVDRDDFDSIFTAPIAEDAEDLDAVEKKFKDFLMKHRSMRQSTILSNLKLYNKDFVEKIGEDKIKEKFPEGKSFDATEMKWRLESLCRENNYILGDEEIEAISPIEGGTPTSTEEALNEKKSSLETATLPHPISPKPEQNLNSNSLLWKADQEDSGKLK